MTERFSNEAATTLVATITGAATSLTVASSSGFPAANFRIRIDDELMIVTAVVGTTWTVTRGAEGTGATGHSSGAAIQHVLTAGGLEQALADVLATGTVIQIAAATITTSSPTYATAAYATIPEMQVTMTTTAGSKVLVLARNTCTHSAANVLTIMALAQDGGAEGNAMAESSSSSAGNFFATFTFGLFTPSAASHTWRARWFTNSGTLTANGVDRAMFAIEFKSAG